MEEEKRVFGYGEFFPELDQSVFLAPGSKIVGRVKIGSRSSVWYNTVVRGDADSVTIGCCTNIQDGCTLHEDPGFPLVLGDGVSVGHNCILHGCRIEDNVLVGMGAVILNGAHIGAGAVIGAGSLVVQGLEIPPGHLAMGLPAKIIRPLGEEEAANFRAMADKYMKRAQFMLGKGTCPDAAL
ncbi:MAG: gamma carbonic anhydrase family protein [Actinobacteria bacterium]|nr:gamma carbonic anhydrase family protein [Actinomycetota bacterium]